MKLLLPFLLLATPVAAQDVTITQDGARYAMRATVDGTLRLDTNTGETTLCTTDGGKLRCEVSAEERAAYEAEIDELGSRLEQLEQRLIALEGPGDPTRPEREQVDRDRGDHDRIDRAVGMAERAMRGFAGAVKRLKNDFEN